METVLVTKVSDGLAKLNGQGEGSHPFDLILLDQNVAGFNTFAPARAVGETLQELPVILLGSFSDVECSQDASDSMFNVLINKPVYPSVLLDGLVKALSQSEKFHPIDTRYGVPRGPEAALPSACILLAEDNPVNQLVAVETLKGMGHTVEVARDGEAAVGAFKRGHYDLVLMDLQMPRLDGYGATEAIRRIEAEEGREVRIPIIALTADALDGERDKCLAAGMNDFLTKPFTLEILDKVLASWLTDNRSASATGR